MKFCLVDCIQLKKVIYLALVLLTSGAVASAEKPAAQPELSQMSLPELIRFISANCQSQTHRCGNGLSRSEIKNLAEPLKGRLNRVAHDQAQIWADTILEGDYVAEGPTALGKVYRYNYQGQLIAYHITYSEKAWDVSECYYDGLRRALLDDCRSGRISESSFVSADFSEAEQDEKNFAHFVTD